MFLGLNHAAQQRWAIPPLARVSGGRPGERRQAFSGHFTGASGFPLGIKTHYILCSSAESTTNHSSLVKRAQALFNVSVTPSKTAAKSKFYREKSVIAGEESTVFPRSCPQMRWTTRCEQVGYGFDTAEPVKCERA
jgi:hypothetical protein